MPPKSAKELQEDAYKKVSVGKYSNGQPVLVNKRTRAMLREAEAILGYPLTIVQGSYHTTNPSSAGTHDGGGVVDLLAWDADTKVRALRKVGFAAWHRVPSEGDWGAHVHAVALGDKKLSAGAKSQVADYKAGKNGLASHLPDPVPKPKPAPKNFNYVKWIGEEGTAAEKRKAKANRQRLENPKPKSKTPNQDAIEAAALNGLMHAETPRLTRFFAGILEQVRQGPGQGPKSKANEASGAAYEDGLDRDVADDGTVLEPAKATAPAKKAPAKKAAARKKPAKKAPAKRPK